MIEFSSEPEQGSSDEEGRETYRQESQTVYPPFATALIAQFRDINPSQLRVCYLIRQGYSRTQIAEILRLRVRSILAHERALRARCGVASRVELRAWLLSL